MPNRQQNHQSGSQRYGSNRPSDDDDRDYGRYTENDEGESGSTGRYAGSGNIGQGDYSRSGRSTGQDRYGQTGYGQGGYGQGSQGQPNYSYGQPSYGGQDFGSSGTSNYGRSNYGSGRYDRESEYSRSGVSSGSYGSQSGWREPYGEGQQYGSGQQSGGGGSSQGMHRGKGPKNYQRSDERMKEMLCERLHDDPAIDASEVTVNVQGGKITLEGTVDSRHTKNAIEDIAEQLGSQDVQNNLRVQKAGERGGMETSSKSSTSAKSSLGEEGEQSKQKRN